MPELAPPLDPLRERVVLMAEIAPGRYFKLVVRGAWDPRACDRVIAHLELTRRWCREDEEAATAAAAATQAPAP